MSEVRNDEAGYVEFVNEDVPFIVREIDGRVAILLELEPPRRVIGYRVYDPGYSPSELFGNTVLSLAPQVKDTPELSSHVATAEHQIVSADRVYKVLKTYRDHGRFDWDHVGYICRGVAALATTEGSTDA